MKPFEIVGQAHLVAGTERAAANVYTVHMGSIQLHFSYNTLIGVHVFDPSERSYRVHNAWGPTTGKHMRQCGLDMARVVTESELFEIVRGALFADVVAAPLNHTDMKEVA